MQPRFQKNTEKKQGRPSHIPQALLRKGRIVFATRYDPLLDWKQPEQTAHAMTIYHHIIYTYIYHHHHDIIYDINLMHNPEILAQAWNILEVT